MANEERRTDSGIEIRPVYDARDLEGWNHDAQLGASSGGGGSGSMHR